MKEKKKKNEMNKHWGADNVYTSKFFFIAGIIFGIYAIIKSLIEKAPLKDYLIILGIVLFVWILAVGLYCDGINKQNK